MEQNMVGWFEVPVTDMARARAFYEHLFGVGISVHQMGDLEMGWFPFAQGKSGAAGALVRHPEFYRPSASDGVVLYFSCPEVADALERVQEAGGTILQEKKEIGAGYGYMGLFLDSEGNRIALHSLK